MFSKVFYYACHMTYADIVKHLFKKSGLGVAEYAEQVGYSTTRISNLLNDSPNAQNVEKIAKACIKNAGQKMEDYLCFPEKMDSADERSALHQYKALSSENRKVALKVLSGLTSQQDLEEKKLRNKRT
jgi:transcriptional regulator with XRE-family HTH domain